MKRLRIVEEYTSGDPLKLVEETITGKPTSYRIEVSTDGKEWTLLKTLDSLENADINELMELFDQYSDPEEIDRFF